VTLSGPSSRVSERNFRFRRAARALSGAPRCPQRSWRCAPCDAGRLDTWIFRQFTPRERGFGRFFSCSNGGDAAIRARRAHLGSGQRPSICDAGSLHEFRRGVELHARGLLRRSGCASRAMPAGVVSMRAAAVLGRPAPAERRSRAVQPRRRGATRVCRAAPAGHGAGSWSANTLVELGLRCALRACAGCARHVATGINRRFWSAPQSPCAV